jgi:hypothetical protein
MTPAFSHAGGTRYADRDAKYFQRVDRATARGFLSLHDDDFPVDPVG